VAQRSGSVTQAEDSTDATTPHHPSPILLHDYERIAPEYYDATRHPTCADFRDASALLLRRALEAVRPNQGCYCEVGCGNSLLCELLDTDRGRDMIKGIKLLDSSESMLSYSARRWEHHGAELRIEEARQLPFTGGTVDLLVSCLGDPYNDRIFWQQVARVLSYDGVAIFTTPSYDWASYVRSAEDRFYSTFELRDGSIAQVPSMILAREDQLALFEDAKLVTEQISEFRLSQLGQPRLGSKVAPERGPDGSVVTCYVVRPR
jgi:SAM-dependent methyltransferase